jgi:hypothetical protein
MSSPGRLAVVYLARHFEGLDALRDFVDSYRSHRAGCEHDLVVIYKGYPSDSELQQAREVFADLAPRALEIDDQGFDIDAYLTAARRLEHPYCCFLNTHTRIVADDWLAKLAEHGLKSEVGVAAAMGSFESHTSSARYAQRIKGYCLDRRNLGDPATEYYFAFMLNLIRHVLPGRGKRAALARWKMRLLDGCRAAANQWYTRSRFPQFPNPHIRSNAFLMKRERLLSLGFGQMRTKWDAYAFESGQDSLTARLRRQGLATLIVNRQGQCFDVPDWARSETFRLGDQPQLLVSDNQTRMFMALAPGHQAVVTRMTWGDYLGPPPDDYPDVGMSLARATRRPHAARMAPVRHSRRANIA